MTQSAAATVERPSMADLAYLTWLTRECGYLNVAPLPGRRWRAVLPLMFTHAVIVGRLGDAGYDDRWCFHSKVAAVEALERWDGMGEPVGWHRHPDTDRRRIDGDAAYEYTDYKSELEARARLTQATT